MWFADSLPIADDLIRVTNPRELGATSLISNRLPTDLDMVRYRLLDRSLLGERFNGPIAIHSRLHLGDLWLTRINERFQTEMEIAGAGLSRYWFGVANAGSFTVQQGECTVMSEGSVGLALRGRAGTRLVGNDGGIRTNLWIEAEPLERALSEMLNDELRQPLDFRVAVDWGTGLAASVPRQIDYLASELGRPDGLTSNEIAVTAFNELVLRTVLQGVQHNYSERLHSPKSLIAPTYIRRADEFMRAHAAQPLRMRDVAAACGCSVRTLEMGYRRFRETTPLAAMRVVRLDRVRTALQDGSTDAIAELARHYGFTNLGRFMRLYRQRYNEAPSETRTRKVRRRASVVHEP